MPARQTRRPRRRIVPSASLPRPEGGEAPSDPGEDDPQVEAAHEARARRHHAAPRHHVREDYGYVRTDLLTVAVVGGVTLAFVLAASFLV